MNKQQLENFLKDVIVAIIDGIIDNEDNDVDLMLGHATANAAKVIVDYHKDILGGENSMMFAARVGTKAILEKLENEAQKD